jgi:hypothetical protein
MDIHDTGGFLYENNHPPFFIGGFPTNDINESVLNTLIPPKVTRDYLTPIGLSSYEGVVMLAEIRARRNLNHIVDDVCKYIETFGVKLNISHDIPKKKMHELIYSICKDLRLADGVVLKKTNRFLSSINAFRQTSPAQRKKISHYILTQCKNVDLIKITQHL